MAQWLLVVVGLAIWGAGVWFVVGGAWALGGGLMILGGLCLVVAASGGWTDFFEALTNWLYFWR